MLKCSCIPLKVPIHVYVLFERELLPELSHAKAEKWINPESSPDDFYC